MELAENTDETQRPRGRRQVVVLTLIPLVVFAALVALFAVRLGGGDPARLPSALIGAKVPGFDLPPLANLRDREGRPVPGLSSSVLARGRVSVANVWASWCAPCREEHPILVSLAARPEIQLVGIDYKDKADNARRFLGTFGNPFAAVGVDEAGRAAIDLGVYGVPETFVIGPDGTIRYKHVGPITADALPGLLEEIRKAAR